MTNVYDWDMPDDVRVQRPPSSCVIPGLAVLLWLLMQFGIFIEVLLFLSLWTTVSADTCRSASRRG